ncbi:poly(A)-binding protein binding protein [Thecaphora frezii]
MAAPNYRGAATRGNAPNGGPGNRNSYFGAGRSGGVGGGRGGGPPPASRWGNGPPSNASPAANRNAPPGRHNGGGNHRNSMGPGYHHHHPHQQQHHHHPQQQQTAAGNSASAFPSLGGVANLDESQKIQRSRMLFLLVSLVGNPVTVHVRGGTKYFGILSSANADSGDLGVAIASVQQIFDKGGDEFGKVELGPLKKMLIVHGRDLESIEASEIRIGDQEKEMKEARDKEAFRTDTEISRGIDPLGNGRTLQRWSDDPDLAKLDSDVPEWAAADGNGGLDGDGSGNAKGWDQFAANEARFGIKSDYEETLYTTTLDRSGKDFKEKEREAERIAREIMSQSTNNPHLAEERGQTDDSGANEEDKYGAVVRGPNAYVPPALRKAAAAAAAAAGKGAASNGLAAAVAGRTNGSAAAVPANAVSTKAATGPSAATSTAAPAPAPAPALAPIDAAAAAASGAPAAAAPATADAAPSEPKTQEMPPPPIVNVKVPSPNLPHQEQSKSGAASPESAKKNPDAANPLMGDFRQFVSSERERLEKKKAALAKKEKDTRLADLKTWASTFKLKTPMPNDVASVVQKDKQASDKPRGVALQKSLSPQAGHVSAASSRDKAGAAASGADTSKLSSAKASAGTSSSLAPSPSGGAGSAISAKGGAKLAETKAMLANMTIPKIPPYNPERAKARQAAAAAAAAAANGKPADAATAAIGAASADASKGDKAEATGVSSSTSAFRLSAKASAFKPFNPNATAFTPSGSASAAKKPDSAAASPAISAASTTPAVPVNKFFGNRILKKPSTSASLHVREDFNPFKVSKVPDAKSIAPMWAFSGKPYRQHFVVAGPQMPFDDGSGAGGGMGSVGVGNGGAMYLPAGPGVGMPMHAAAPQPTHPMQHQPHGGQGQPPHIPVSGPPGAGPAAPGQQQPFGMVYQPYGPYRFHNQPQPQPQGQIPPQQHGMVQPMQMPPNSQGPPVPYGGMPPQFMGQMPFSPPMPPHAAGQALYSPQMANMPPPGQQFVPGGPGGAGGPHNVGPPGPQGGQGPPVRPPPPHLQQQQPQHPNQHPQPQKGGHPPSQMYYPQPQPGPMGGMPYPPQFGMPPGPQPVRPVGPPMGGSTGPGSEASSTVGMPTGHGGAEPPSH